MDTPAAPPHPPQPPAWQGVLGPDATPPGYGAGVGFGMGGGGGFSTPDLMAELRRALRALWRYRLLIAAILVLGVVGSAVVALSLPPKYVAYAQVLVGGGRQGLLDQQQQQGSFELLGSDIVVEGETQVLMSRDVAEMVIRRTGLLYDPALNPALGWSGAVATGSPAEAEAVMMAAVVEDFHKRLTVAQVGKSRVIDIAYEDRSPERAAMVANAVAQAYLDRQVEDRRKGNQATIQALRERIDELRRQVAEKEGKAAAYRSSNRLPEAGQTAAASQQVSAVSAQIAQERSTLAAVQAQRAAVDKAVAGGNVDLPGGMADTPVISALRAQKAQAVATLAQVQATYRGEHPAVTRAAAVVGGLDAAIRRELSSMVRELRATEGAQQARVSELERVLEQYRQEEGRLTDAQVELRALDREADSARKILESFLGRAAEAQELQGTERPDASVVSAASPPRIPTAPKKKLIVAGGAIAALFVALLLVLWLEQTETRLMSIEQAEAWTATAVLAVLPDVAPEAENGLAPQQVVVENLGSPYSTAMRALHLALAPPDRVQPPGAILITAAGRGEGKTTTAVSLARALALEGGLRVVVIDANRAAPAVHLATGCIGDFGLIDLVRDGAELDRVIQSDPVSPLHVLPIGSHTDLGVRLQDLQLRGLVQALRRRYDAIIIDGPGILSGADAGAWAGVSDRVLMVVAPGVSREAPVREALRILRGVRGRLAGTVFNRATEQNVV